MTEKHPLAISCKASHCGPKIAPAERRHAFVSPVGALPGLGGSCGSCGELDLVDWERCHRLDSTDITAVVGELRKELIRDNYWSIPLPDRILRNAQRRSPEQLRQTSVRLLQQTLRVGNPGDGWQTPFATSDNAMIGHCAQHATGTCCRQCLEKWFGIERWVPLDAETLDYLALLHATYIDERNGLVLAAA